MKDKHLTSKEIAVFHKEIYTHYDRHKRRLPWRETTDPYKILVSEVMLQQTQVERVIPVYEKWLVTWPTVGALAQASLQEVLMVWVGMGYNRRARYLLQAARMIQDEHAGRVPDQPDALLRLPGVGPYTAAAIVAFAFNQPVVVVDTNIRSVYIHRFFPGRLKVADAEVRPLIEQTLDKKEPARWYNALMDYGANLKTKVANPSRKSAGYTRQTRFSGSDRQIRGQVIKLLTRNKSVTPKELMKIIPVEPTRLNKILIGLAKEGMITEKSGRYRLES